MPEDITEAQGRIIREALNHQLGAALATLESLVRTCPEDEWPKDHGDAPFSQVVFHTLFYTDFYLGRDSVPFKDQVFHKARASTFADYEELEYRKPLRVYEREFCLEYLAFCREKAEEVLGQESLASLVGPSGIDFRPCSRLELYAYGLRHIQHHAAQLGLRLQLATGQEMAWVAGH